VLGHEFFAKAVKVKTLATGENGGGYLVGLGGRQNENHMLRGLLERLQQGIERLGGEHVNFIDDIDLVRAFLGCELTALPQLPDFVDAPVGSAVDFETVEGSAVGDAAAGLTLETGLGGHAFGTVQAFGQESGYARLARSPWAGKEVGMGDVLGPQGVLQRANHVLLTHYLGKSLWPPAAVE
jgi:hypothetical protein